MTAPTPRASAPAEAAATPVVAIVGRPNVGKSALFNRMVRRRVALVEDIPGTTRDRLYGNVEWRGRLFRLVDTGGLDLEARTSLSALVRQQVQAAVDEAQVILFVVDSAEGVTAADVEVADVLRRTAKPALMLANKAESKARQEAAVEFYELGLGEPFPVSAHHGTGVADVMDILVDILPPATAGEEAETLRIAIVGRPNVGKSLLLNAILGEERVIVSEVPGTTRDSIWSWWTRRVSGDADTSQGAWRSMPSSAPGGPSSGRTWPCCCWSPLRG
jgi:GTP-binding protein